MNIKIKYANLHEPNYFDQEDFFTQSTSIIGPNDSNVLLTESPFYRDSVGTEKLHENTR